MKIIFDFKGSVFGQKENIELELSDKATVLESLESICKKIPSLQQLLFKDDDIRNDIVILVDQLDVKAMNLFSSQLKNGQKITILPLAHGG
ncbi:MAG: MoaD/ThiS family protein [Asgard group archaeon]|nr:MoaD/ThiS family protein [Asgard group archaeon]